MIRTFSHRRYIVLATIFTLLIFVGLVWSSSLSLALRILFDPSLSLMTALKLSSHFLTTSFFDLAFQDFLYMISLALLIGINSTLLLFYISAFRTTPRVATSSSVAGFVAALLGFGCAACGSLFALSLFGTIGGTLIASLPFAGNEIGYLGITLLVASTILLSQAINKPPLCPI